MPTVYIRKDLYDAVVRAKKDPSDYINGLLDASLKNDIRAESIDEKQTKITPTKQKKVA